MGPVSCYTLLLQSPVVPLVQFGGTHVSCYTLDTLISCCSFSSSRTCGTLSLLLHPGYPDLLLFLWLQSDLWTHVSCYTLDTLISCCSFSSSRTCLSRVSCYTLDTRSPVVPLAPVGPVCPVGPVDLLLLHSCWIPVCPVAPVDPVARLSSQHQFTCVSLGPVAPGYPV